MPRLTPQEVDVSCRAPRGPFRLHQAEWGAAHLAGLVPVESRQRTRHRHHHRGIRRLRRQDAKRRRNPKVSLSVATDEWPYQYVILEGEATVSSDNIKEAVRTIFSRYEGAERGEEDATELTEGDQQLVAIVINVKRILSWKGDAE